MTGGEHASLIAQQSIQVPALGSRSNPGARAAASIEISARRETSISKTSSRKCDADQP